MGKLKNDIRNQRYCKKENWLCDDCKYYDHKKDVCIVKILLETETYDLYQLIRKSLKNKEKKHE